MPPRYIGRRLTPRPQGWGGARPLGCSIVRILFITSNRLGDAVLTTGLLGHLVDAHPGARVTIACGPVAAPLFQAVPGLDALIPMPKRRFAGHWLDLWRRVVGQHWDLVVDLRDSAVSRLVWGRRKAVFRGGDGREHKVVSLGRVLGLTPPPDPRLFLSDTLRAAARALLAPAPGAPGGAPLLALGPAANWTGKEWPADHFADLALGLLGPGGHLAGGRALVLATAAERPRCQDVLDRLTAALGPDRVIDAVGATDPALAGACLAAADLFVGNDSGLMHLAAAAGTPTVGIFGPTPVHLYGPWGLRARPVVATPSPDATAQALMASIPVAQVAAAAVALLRQAGAAPIMAAGAGGALRDA